MRLTVNCHKTDKNLTVNVNLQARPGVLGIRYLGRLLPRYSVFCAKIFSYRVLCITIIYVFVINVFASLRYIRIPGGRNEVYWSHYTPHRAGPEP